MKKITALTTFIVILGFMFFPKAHSYASYISHKAFSETYHDDVDFTKWQKNIIPEGVKFKSLTKSHGKISSFYVIYKNNQYGEGYYYKIAFDKNGKPVETSYAVEHTNKLSSQTLDHIKNIFYKENDAAKNLILREPDPASCVIKCHRENGCYDKPTNTGVLLCSADCQLNCV